MPWAESSRILILAERSIEDLSTAACSTWPSSGEIGTARSSRRHGEGRVARRRRRRRGRELLRAARFSAALAHRRPRDRPDRVEGSRPGCGRTWAPPRPCITTPPPGRRHRLGIAGHPGGQRRRDLHRGLGAAARPWRSRFWDPGGAAGCTAPGPQRDRRHEVVQAAWPSGTITVTIRARGLPGRRREGRRAAWPTAPACSRRTSPRGPIASRRPRRRPAISSTPASRAFTVPGTGGVATSATDSAPRELTISDATLGVSVTALPEHDRPDRRHRGPDLLLGGSTSYDVAATACCPAATVTVWLSLLLHRPDPGRPRGDAPSRRRRTSQARASTSAQLAGRVHPRTPRPGR